MTIKTDADKKKLLSESPSREILRAPMKMLDLNDKLSFL